MATAASAKAATTAASRTGPFAAAGVNKEQRSFVDEAKSRNAGDSISLGLTIWNGYSNDFKVRKESAVARAASEQHPRGTALAVVVPRACMYLVPPCN